MGGTPAGSWSSGPLIAEHTVASVGPYTLIIRRPVDHCPASAAGQGSPATLSVMPVGRPSGGIAASAVGGSLRCVTSLRRTVLVSAGPGSSWCGAASTSVAPVHRARKMSDTEASKLGEANCNTRLPGPMPSRAACAVTRPGRPECVTTTPFGTPVDPEV